MVLTKSSGSKSHAVAVSFIKLIFAGFCVCHTGLSGGGEELAYTVSAKKNAHFSNIIRFFKFQSMRVPDEFRSVLKLCS
jgi:hypothetical protein